MRLRTILVSCSVVALAAVSLVPAHADTQSRRAHPAVGQWHQVSVPTTQRLRGLAAVNRKVAWVGGNDGGIWRTGNGGRSWGAVNPGGTSGLQFRDIEAVDAKTALALSIGEGDASRIYRTTNGGRSWRLAFVNQDPAAFYDCMALYPDGKHGLAVSDPVGGRFQILRTKNGGKSWRLVSPVGMPPAVAGEAAFAASGTCLTTSGDKHAWLATGGTASRVFHSHNRGRTWSVTGSPIPANGTSAGTFSIAVQDGSKGKPGPGIAVGGDFNAEGDGSHAAARRHGAAWVPGGNPNGYRSGVAWLPKVPGFALAVGPRGTDLTRNAGKTWTLRSETSYDSVDCADAGVCWASGANGAVGRLRFHPHRR